MRKTKARGRRKRGKDESSSPGEAERSEIPSLKDRALMLRTSAPPRALGYVGVAVILAPIWFVGIGVSLRRGTVPAVARARLGAPIR